MTSNYRDISVGMGWRTQRNGWVEEVKVKHDEL